MSRARPRRTRDGLRGPTAPPLADTPPDLGLSPTTAEDLERRIRILLHRWQPHTEDPNNLVRDLYKLIAWLLAGEPPTCPVLNSADVENDATLPSPKP